MRYSKSNKGFNTGAVDEIEISVERWLELLDGEASGQEIYGDDEGLPQLREHIYSDEELSKTEKLNRDAKLKNSDFTQLDDSPKDKQAWKLYRQHLRDIPDQPGFPHDIDWGVAPE